MPDGWFSPKEEVPYLYLSANPWACSCSLGYLHRYLEENEFNIYTRSGPLITNNPGSVVSTAAPLLTVDCPTSAARVRVFSQQPEQRENEQMLR